MSLNEGTTIFGYSLQIFAKINGKVSLFLYQMMGWLKLSVPAIVTKTEPAFWGLCLLEDCHTIGAAFYAKKKKPYFHMIWHLMLASAPTLIRVVYFYASLKQRHPQGWYGTC